MKPSGSASVKVEATPTRNNMWVWIALVAVYLIWGSTYLAISVAIKGFPPFLMAGIRFLAAGGIMFIFLRVRGTPSPSRKQWLGLIAIGALLLVGGNGGVIIAEQWVASGLAAVWISTMPLWAALFAGLWGRWPNRLEWIGLGLGLVGVGLLNLENNLQANPLGAVALLISTICWAFGSVWSQRLSLPTGMMSSAGEMLAGGVIFMALSLAFGEKLAGPPPAESIWAVAYLVVFGSIVAFSAYLYLLRRVRPALATSYAYVNPVVAVALGVGLAQEPISWVGIAAMAIIISAVGLVVAGRGR
jgi:drug/metabolite transporter (DMT)-like permease